MPQLEEPVLHIAEIPHPSGAVAFRYARIPSADGTQWVRHGLFCAYDEDGQLVSEGGYENGLEDGLWRDFHSNGQLAAEGLYVAGKEHGLWRHWAPDGSPEADVTYVHGVEQAA
jgi:antitoxin component YwqK of YwqJK toxin-antitoxin module